MCGTEMSSIGYKIDYNEKIKYDILSEQYIELLILYVETRNKLREAEYNAKKERNNYLDEHAHACELASVLVSLGATWDHTMGLKDRELSEEELVEIVKERLKT